MVEFPGQPEVGNIRVEASEMNDDIIVYLGNFYHDHFEWHRDIEASQEAGYNQMVSEALDLIHRFMRDEIIIKVIYAGETEISRTAAAR